MKKKLEELKNGIENSFANNNEIYPFLEGKASLNEIVTFLYWDSQQPAFKGYLELWVDLVPQIIKPALVGHIEEETGHSDLFKNMLNHLVERTGCPIPDYGRAGDRLAQLNYTFSKKCQEENSYGFFLGSFWATEVMSAKRCKQLFNGLKRNGINEGDLEYLKIHLEIDNDHGNEVLTKMIVPVSENNLVLSSVEAGVKDRLERSERFLRWYFQQK